MIGILTAQTTTLERLPEVIDGLNACERASHEARGYTSPPDVWHARERSKYVAIDCRHSGAFLVEKATGELFNIKSYGVPDQNKKRKADIGNIQTVDPAELHRRRHNYLR